MVVYKFGGASIKDAEAVKNMAKILSLREKKPCIIVISAMGKTTNSLEELCNSFYKNDAATPFLLKEIKNRHLKVLNKLFEDEEHAVFKKVHSIFNQLEGFISKKSKSPFDFIYDKIVSHGELLSTTIISEYLNFQGIKNTWIDVREVIKTSSEHRDPKINWNLTDTKVQEIIVPVLQKSTDLIVTQGFLGSTTEGHTTTLGREGSDFTAAIFSNILNAEKQVVWKDVPGILNADPNQFQEAVKIDKLSYDDAVEMTFYGATVIHPKTIKPLQNKNIPLYVQSFLNPGSKGTTILNSTSREEKVPIIILKKNQIILRISTKDFSFMAEDNLSFIYKIFDKLRISITMTENAAISLTVCLDNNPGRINKLLEKLEDRYEISVLKNVEVLTVKNYNEDLIKKLTSHRIIRFEQRRNDLIRFILQ
ncbi:MAG: aspartate kinase [Chitinophagaceae bacterium]|nr:MAG: aspartate kinase [Chitinophagaceae bacterium]